MVVIVLPGRRVFPALERQGQGRREREETYGDVEALLTFQEK